MQSDSTSKPDSATFISEGRWNMGELLSPSHRANTVAQ
jgi:hypothetical protein